MLRMDRWVTGGGALLLIAALLLLTACGGGGGGRKGPNVQIPLVGEPPVRDADGLDLDGLALSVAKAPQLAPIEVLGLPEDAKSDSLYAEFFQLDAGMFGAEGVGGVLALFTQDGRVYLHTPLVDPEGGAIVVVITDGKSRSEAFGLELAPLPAPQAGILERFIDGFYALLRAATEELGKDYPREWEFWRDQSFNNIPVYLIPLAQSYLAVLDHENEHSLLNVTQALQADERELLERIMAGSDLVGIVERWTELIENKQTALTYVGSVESFPAVSAAEVEGRTRSGTSRTATGDIWRTAGTPRIADADTLALLLGLYQSYQRSQRDAQLLDETLGAYIRGIVLVGSIPTKGGSSTVIAPAVRKAMGWVTNALSGTATLAGVAQWFLPCCITDLDVELSPAGGVIASEDALPNQVRLASARGVAQSHGVDITREIADRLISRVTKSALSDVVTKVYGENARDLIMDAGVTPALRSVLRRLPPGASLVFVWEDIDLMSTSPQTWLEVEIDTLGSSGTPIVEQAATGDDRMEFRLVAPAAFQRTDSLLRFKTNFANLPAPVAIDTKPITLRYMAVEFVPPAIRLTAGDTEVPFQIHVRNSELFAGDVPFIDLPVTVDPPLGRVEYLDVSPNGVLHFRYLPPAKFPPGVIATVRADAISQSGIRHPSNNPPPRTGTMFITAEPVRVAIAPRTACLDNGETLRREARDPLSNEAVAVSWQADKGAIAADGVYRAPATGSGEATIRAVAHANEEASAIASIVYGMCDCWWQGSVTGTISQSHGWSTMWIEVDETGRIIKLAQGGLSDYASGVSYRGFSVDLRTDPIPAGATGSYRAKIADGGGNFSADSLDFWANPSGWTPELLHHYGLVDPAPLTVTVHEHDMISAWHSGVEGSRRLRASVSGQVVRYWFEEGRLESARSGALSAEVQGSYWIPLGAGQLNCSPGL